MDGKARPLLLRLDSGAVLCSRGEDGTAVQLSARAAYEARKVRLPHLQKMRGLLQELLAKLPNAQPLHEQHSGSKRNAVAEPQELAPSKRARSDVLNGGLHHQPSFGRQASPSTASGLSWHGGDFADKCVEIVDRCLTELGSQAYIFSQPVNGDAVPDYYHIIKNPMDFGTIRRRLMTNQYTTPEQFLTDAQLVFHNCHLYNKKGTMVHKLGVKLQNSFMQRWYRTGLGQQLRTKRSTAGLGPQKYEPQDVVEKKPRNRAPARPKQVRNDPLPTDMMMEMAEYLQTLDESQLHEVTDVLKRAGHPVTGGDGEEIELDFEVMEPKVMWELYDWVQSRKPAANEQQEDYDDVDDDDEY